jgi:hypothetical protein
MSARGGTHYVISANATDTGASVYWAHGGVWVASLREALCVETDAERDAILAEAARQERRVCDPYAFRVAVEDGVIDPLSVREHIRASGPTTRLRRPDREPS